MLDLDPVTERGLIIAGINAGLIYGVTRVTLRNMQREIRELRKWKTWAHQIILELRIRHERNHGEPIHADYRSNGGE